MLDLSKTAGLAGFAFSCDHSAELSITGTPDEHKFTRSCLQDFKLTHTHLIDPHLGNLHSRTAPTKTFDFVFWQPESNEETLWQIFEYLLPSAGDDSLFIFAGPHRSSSSNDDWEKIKDHGSVCITLDLFFWGLVFFRKGQAKQHFKIRV